MGERTPVWLAPVLSQADHRRNQVQEWASRRLASLRGCGLEALTPVDVTDDRLADVLRLLSDDERSRNVEQELMGHLLRVSPWEASGVRMDTTTVSSETDVDDQGLLQLGQRKESRPDLPQGNVALARVDPFGVPLATEVLSGEQADDPVYVPWINRVRQGLAPSGWLSVGDGNMAARQTRASLQAQGEVSLCPLLAWPVPAAEWAQEVHAPSALRKPVWEVIRQDEKGEPTGIAQGEETVQQRSVLLGERTIPWQERRLLIPSMAAQKAAQSRLLERLQQAEQALRELAVRRQGTPRLTSRQPVEEPVASLLSSLQVESLLSVPIQEEKSERPVRASRGTWSSPHTIWRFQVRVEQNPEAIQTAIRLLGWRVSASNQQAPSLGLAQAGEASGDDDLVERHCSRLTGHPLSLGPLDVQRDDHRVGLVRLLPIALRVLTVLEGVVRHHLGQHQEAVGGLFAGHPKRQTTQPTAERLWETFREIRLPIVSAPGFVQRQVTPLSLLQPPMFARCGFSSAVSVHLAGDS